MRCVRQEAALNELPVRLSSHLVIYLVSKKKVPACNSCLTCSFLRFSLVARTYVFVRPCTCGREEAVGEGKKALGFQVPARRKYVLHLCCAELEPRL